MSSAAVDLDISALSSEQRLELVERLWDSLVESDSVPFTDAQRVELDRRLDRMERGEGENVPLEDALARIRSRGADR